VDTKKGIYLAAKHLIDQGHTAVSYIGPKTDILEGSERFGGYNLAMGQSGLVIDQDFVFLGEHNELFGYESAKKLLKLGKLPTAICCATDLIALGIYRAFETSDIKLPVDIAITGMDNIQFCTYVKPKLTSVSIVQGEIGRMAANIIFDRLNGNTYEKRKNIIFNPRLVVRESSTNYTDGY
jgi:LacI family transcriptional regulator